MYIFSVTSDTDYIAELYVQLDYDVVSSSNYFLLNVTNLQTNVSRAVVLTKVYANDRNTKFNFTFYAEDNEAKDRTVRKRIKMSKPKLLITRKEKHS